MTDHEHWEELAAGYALDALEPDEAATFTAHLATCAHCEAVLADHAFVAAQLGTMVDEHAEVPAWSSIRGQVVGTTVTSLDAVRQRRRGSWLLGAAAALLLVAAGATWFVSRPETQTPQQVALSQCARTTGCHVVKLQDKATLVVSDGTVRLVASSLPAPSPDHVYVLWQLPRGGRMTLVGSLQQVAAGRLGETHQLVLPYEDTTAFGLSLEPTTTVPANPSDVVAVGAA